jgi:hypothetical protein
MFLLGIRRAALIAAALVCAATAVMAQTNALENLPLSGGVLMARKVLAERAAPAAAPAATPGEAGGIGIDLSCNPKPCVLPNAQASAGPNPVNENAIAANPAKATDLVSTGNDYNCPTLQGIFSSIDSGSTWRRTCTTPLPGYFGLGDPVPGYNRKGTAYVVGINSPDGGFSSVVAIQSSTDKGLTWGPARQAVPATLGGLADKPWLEVDTQPTSPFRDSLYVSVTQFDPTFTRLQITVSRSRDGGKTWKTSNASALQTSPDIVQFSDLAIGRDGTVYLTYMKCGATSGLGNCGGTNAAMVFQKSTDGGVTWSAPVTMATVRLATSPCGAFYGCLPNTGERVSNIPAIAVDNSTGPNSGKLYSVMYDFTGGAMKIQVVSSTNDGSTWSAPKRVVPTNVAGDQFFPWISVNNGSGEIAVTWHDRRDDPSNVNYHAYGASSTNGGASYPLNVRLSKAASNPFNDGFSGTFMGDYSGSAWAGNTLFMSYTDTRTGTAQNWVAGGSR